MRLKLSETLKEIAAAAADRSGPDLDAIQKELDSVRVIYPYLALQLRCLTCLIEALRHAVGYPGSESVPGSLVPDSNLTHVDGRGRMPVYHLLLQIADCVRQRDRAALVKLSADMARAQKRIAGTDGMAPAMQALIDSCRDLVDQAAW